MNSPLLSGVQVPLTEGDLLFWLGETVSLFGFLGVEGPLDLVFGVCDVFGDFAFSLGDCGVSQLSAGGEVGLALIFCFFGDGVADGMKRSNGGGGRAAVDDDERLGVGDGDRFI